MRGDESRGGVEGRLPDRAPVRVDLLALALSNRIGRTRVSEVLEVVGLSSVARRRIGGFSLGMAQRLGIAAALLGDPPVLIFDEPVNGLDPEGVAWIRTLLRSLAAQGRTVFLSSHLMTEMALTADRLIIVGRGRRIAETTVAEFLDAGPDAHVQVRTSDSVTLADLLRSRGTEVDRVGPDTLRVSGCTSDEVGQLARDHGLAVLELATRRTSLEQRYLELTSDALDYRAASAPLPAHNPR